MLPQPLIMIRGRCFSANNGDCEITKNRVRISHYLPPQTRPFLVSYNSSVTDLVEENDALEREKRQGDN